MVVGRPPPATAILQLQRTHGNQAVQQMLARNKTKVKVSDFRAEFTKAAKAGDWNKAAMASFVIDDDKLRKLLGKLSDAELGLLETEAQTLAAVLPGLGDRIHRHVSFQRHAPAKAQKQKDATVPDEGTLEHEEKVDGGKVKVHTDAEFKLSDGTIYSEAFSLSYKGKQASSTRWLQFIWREIEVDDPTKGTFRLDEPVSTTGGSYRLTTDPAKPSYNTDTASTTDPFYDAGAVNNRTSEATTIFDQPAPARAKVDAQFDAGATKVVSRAHFTSYLVRDMSVLEKVNIDVEWVFNAKGDVPRTHHVAAGAAQRAGSPDPRQAGAAVPGLRLPAGRCRWHPATRRPARGRAGRARLRHLR